MTTHAVREIKENRDQPAIPVAMPVAVHWEIDLVTKGTREAYRLFGNKLEVQRIRLYEAIAKNQWDQHSVMLDISKHTPQLEAYAQAQFPNYVGATKDTISQIETHINSGAVACPRLELVAPVQAQPIVPVVERKVAQEVEAVQAALAGLDCDRPLEQPLLHSENRAAVVFSHTTRINMATIATASSTPLASTPDTVVDGRPAPPGGLR